MRGESRRICVVLLTGVLGGCTTAKHVSQGGWLPGFPMWQEKSVLLMRVADAIEPGEGPAGGSGQALTLGFLEALQKRQVKVSLTEETTVVGAAAQARTLGFRYVMRVAFTTWEDNATAWSGNPDRAGAAAELYDAETAVLVATASHAETASNMTFLASSPDRFYSAIIGNVIRCLFADGACSQPRR
ncbi:MAG: DUF4823 domain-containing protein [Thermoanaerobaculaceae bacterium]|nr:DUF4823 domain-containing protein [Thermoanaerobaculaceae bacterium]